MIRVRRHQSLPLQTDAKQEKLKQGKQDSLNCYNYNQRGNLTRNSTAMTRSFMKLMWRVMLRTPIGMEVGVWGRAVVGEVLERRGEEKVKRCRGNRGEKAREREWG